MAKKIHVSHRDIYGNNARLYFLAAVLVILIAGAWTLRVVYNYQNDTVDSNAILTPPPSPSSIEDEPSYKTDVSSVLDAYLRLTGGLDSVKADSSVAGSYYPQAFPTIKKIYPDISTLINTLKNANTNTESVESEFAKLKDSVTKAETAYNSKHNDEAYNQMNLALASLKQIIDSAKK